MKKKRHLPPVLPVLGKKSGIRIPITLILSFWLLLPGYAYSQTQRITLDVSGMPVSDVLKNITVQTGIDFFYSDVLFNPGGKVSFSVINATLDETLSRLFEGKIVEYEYDNGVVVIRNLKEIPRPRQKKNITGTVKDRGGQPVIGASVVEKGTLNGVLAGIDGTFSMEVYDNSVLEVSFMGMEKEDVQVGAATNYDIILTESSQTIESVVVTGMTTTDKRLFSGAADRLAADNMMIGGMADISRSLEGRSAGVTVQNVSGTFGTAPKIRIRGATSIYGNSKPLWVVDGVIIEDVTDISSDDLSSGDAITLIGNAIAGLNADDIETFDILKDGSATSIYGARAMSGVIVITTKRGKAGVTRINYSGEFTSRLKPNYRNFNIMNSQDQMSVYQELERKGWLNYASVYRASQSGIYGQMYRLIHQYDAASGQFGLPNTPEARNTFLREAEMRNTDWFDELFSNAVLMNHSVSISSGTEKASSYISMSMMNDPGWYRQSKVQRYTLNANAQYRILDNLTLSVLGNGSYRKQRAPGTVAQEVDAVGGQVSRNFDINPYSYALNTSRTMGPDDTFIRNYTGFNILQELDQNYLQLDLVDTKFQADIKWKIIPGLEVAALGAIRYQSTSQQHHIRDESNYARAFREMSDATIRDSNPWLYKDPDQPNSFPITILDVGGYYEKREYKMSSYDFRTSMTYNKVIDNTHSIYFYGGMEVNAVNRTSDWFRGVGMQYENGEKPFSNYLAFKKYREGNTDYYSLNNSRNRNTAFFGTANYSYKGKYSVSGTVRYEGSNRLGKSRDARWLPTWNVSGAWNMHEEGFFDNLRPAMSHFKPRVSYSLTAEAGPLWVSNSEVIINSYTPWRPGTANDEPGLQVSQPENSELTYEKKYEFNVGFDAGFMNNRINLNFDYYTRNMKDLIGYVTTAGVGGVINKWANTASMRSYGFEFTLSTVNLKDRNFRWTTDFTFSFTKSWITDLKTQANLMEAIRGTGFPREGYNRSSLFSIPFLGLDHEGLPMFQFKDEVITSSNYSNLNFQERANLGFLVYEGSTEPKTTGGFSNIFTYKNFRLNVFMTYSFGNKIRLDPIFKPRYTDMDATAKELKNRWMAAGDENHTDIPVIISSRQNSQYSNISRGYNAYNYSTARIANGSFVRMKEISLAYDFPQRLIDPLKMQHLSLKIQVTNPFLIYADKKLNGQDPEFFRSGGVSSPLAKQFTFTLRMGF